MKALILLPFAIVALGCGSSSETGPINEDTGDDSEFVAGFDPGPVEAGFTRYVTPVLKDLKPGEEREWCQWISEPLDRDMDVLHLKGKQSKFGHHAVLYATTATQPVGTSRLCKEGDMLAVTFLGGLAGEDSTTNEKYKLPEGLAFRVRKGSGFLVNIHFVNTGKETVDGQAVLDLELAEPTDERQVAGLFANVRNDFQVEPAGSLDVSTDCVLERDFDFLMFLNHMHRWGSSALTEIIRADGSRADLVRDDRWEPSLTQEPHIQMWSVDEPFHANKGDTIRTHCAWKNTSGDMLSFPREMCVAAGVYMSGASEDIHCVDGGWSVGGGDAE